MRARACVHPVQAMVGWRCRQHWSWLCERLALSHVWCLTIMNLPSTHIFTGLCECFNMHVRWDLQAVQHLCGLSVLFTTYFWRLGKCVPECNR
jgi:hypothetical protein